MAKIAIYSDDANVRNTLVNALGSSLGSGLPVETMQFATAAALRQYVDKGGQVDLFVLDGEAVPEGGLGVARQLKDEVFNVAPIIVLIARPADRWLAAWSRAEASLQHPVDPFNLATTATQLLNQKLATA